MNVAVPGVDERLGGIVLTERASFPIDDRQLARKDRDDRRAVMGVPWKGAVRRDRDLDITTWDGSFT